jgi:hypothetical protein
MLEKSDLQQIRTIVRTEVRTEIGREIAPVRKDVKMLKADVSKIRKDINLIIEVFDNEHIDLRNRVDQLEEKVGIVN